MSSRSSYGYGSSYGQDKGAYAQRSSSPRSATSYHSTSGSSASSIYANSASSSSRNPRYGNKPPVIHNGGGPSNDPNTSTSVSNSGYYT